MRINGTILAEIDWVFDYIPGVSTASNLVDLFEKLVYKCLPASTQKNRYWTHIHYKDLFRCIILLVPILGNLYVLIFDYYRYQDEKKIYASAIQSHSESQHFQAEGLALLAKQTSGLRVTGNQMMPAPTEDQQRLWAGCLNNDLQTVQKQLNKRILPNFYHSGNRPLVTACQHGSADIVRLLLQHGANANTADRLGMTPLIAACVKGDLEIVKLLRPHIQDIDATHPKGGTALMFASAEGHRTIIEFLLSQGANPRKKASSGEDAVTSALFLKDHVNLLPLLLGEAEDIDERRYRFQIPNRNLFSFLPPPTVDNLTPLLYATIVGAKKSALYLVERSDVQHLDSNLCNALHYSSEDMELLRALLNKCHTPEFVNQQNIAGSTALHRALESDQPDAALLLLQNGADPFISNGYRGPLIAEIDKGVEKALPEAVLGVIADYTFKKTESTEEKTPLILACEKGFDPVVAYIKQHHGHRIGPKLQEEMALATQAFQARRTQPQPAKKESDLSSSAFRLIETSFKMMQSLAEYRAKEQQDIIDNGPIPRTGMELIFGKLDWPV